MKRLLPALAFAGLVIAVVTVIVENRPPKSQPTLISAPQSPFESYVAAAGILEPSTENIAVGTPVDGIVAEIYVKWNDRVKAGDPLFKIDDRDLQARFVSAVASLKSAQAVLEKAQHHLQIAENLKGTTIISTGETTSRVDDVAIDKAAVEVARAHEGEIRTELERRIVRAPVASRVLKINLRRGELAGPTAARPPILLGDDDKLQVEADVDENDAWRVRPDARAVAFVRGNPTVKIPLQFLRIEPYVLPKTALTGKTTERTDVRVLQVIYEFNRRSWPVYDGQQVDVFIEAPAATTRTK